MKNAFHLIFLATLAWCSTSVQTASGQEILVKLSLREGFRPEGQYPVLKITGPSGISMLGMFNEELGTKITDMDGLKLELTNFGSEMIADSVEKKATFIDLESANGTAIYYVITDAEFEGKEVPEGKFRYLTNGMIDFNDGPLFTFTILHNDPDDADRNGLLQSVAEGIKIPAKPEGGEETEMKEAETPPQPAPSVEPTQEAAPSEPAGPPQPIERELTDIQGRKIKATILRIEGENVVFEKEGKEYTFSLSKLSEADKKFLEDWRSNR